MIKIILYFICIKVFNMDFSQNKLSKHEWDGLEKPVSDSEKYILNLIVNGFHNPNICENKNVSLFQFIKTEKTEEMEYYLYNNYFHDIVKKNIKKYGSTEKLQGLLQTSLHQGKELKSLKSSDSIRIQNFQISIDSNKDKIFEYFLIELSCNILR